MAQPQLIIELIISVKYFNELICRGIFVHFFYSIPLVQQNWTCLSSTNWQLNCQTVFNRRCHRISNSGSGGGDSSCNTYNHIWWYCSHLFNFYVNALTHRHSIVSSLAFCVEFYCRIHWFLLSFLHHIHWVIGCIWSPCPSQYARRNESVAQITETCKRS